MGGYKEHKIFDILKRKSIIIKYIIVIVIISIIAMTLIMQKTEEDTISKNIVYTENSNLAYKVYLKENDFFDEKYLKEGNQYIANLIDYIEGAFRYELATKTDENIDYNYSYKIEATVVVKDKGNQKVLYEFGEDLIEYEENTTNTKEKLILKETIKIDYNKYNDIIKRFVDIYDLDDSNAVLTVNMYVNVFDETGQSIGKKDTPAMFMTIPLSKETMTIDMESNSVNENEIFIANNINNNKMLFGAIFLILIDIGLIVKLVIFIKDTKDEKAVYNMRLRKIMSNYGSYIQKLNNEFDFEGYQILEIKSFEDLLQIKETLSKPILVTEKELAMETYFFVQNDSTCYIYELKAGNLREQIEEARNRTKKSVEEINKKRIEELGLHNK